MNSLTGQHVLSCDMFSRDNLEDLFRLADVLYPVARGEMITRVLEGAVMGSMFFEPSTRTRLSFDSAFSRLGGSVSSTNDESICSIEKGESIADTSMVMSGYFDLITIRHPDEHVIYDFADHTCVPVINGGNGAAEHPTQALLDVYTIHRELSFHSKSIDGACVCIVGDLLYGRTVHSLLKLLSTYEGLTVHLVSPESLRVPKALLESERLSALEIKEMETLEEGVRNADVVYATRIQVERFTSPVDAAVEIDALSVNEAIVNEHCKDDVVLMHPLPRDSSISAQSLSVGLNTDPRFAAFRQTDAGVPIRMALICSLLGVAESVPTTLRAATWRRLPALRPIDRVE